MEPRPAERGSRAALAGVVFAVLFAVGWLLLRQSPSVEAPQQELVDYFSDPEQRRSSLIAGLYVLPFAGLAFIWFMAALRDRYVRSGGRENVLLSTVQLLTGSLFVAALFILGAVELTLVWMAETSEADVIDGDAARSMVALGTALGQIVGLRAAAVFVAVSSTRAMKSGLFPRWYGITSLVLAVLLLFVFAAWPPITFLMPAWVVGASILVLAQRESRAHPMGV